MGFRIVTFSNGHYLAKCPWYDAFALLCACPHHGVRFAAACLPIGEYGTVISI